MADPGTTKKRNGPPPLAFGPEDRQRVRTFAGYGFPQRQIARLITNPQTQKPISLGTLRRHFRVELEEGHIQANAQVVESLFNQAVGRQKVVRVTIQPDGSAREEVVVEHVAPDHSCTIFWVKAQGGWMEEDKRQRIGVAARRVDLEAGRLDIARELLKLKGAVDEGEDPQEVALQIKKALDMIQGVTGGTADPAMD